MTENKKLIKPYPLGAHCEAGGIRFSFVSDTEDCGVLLYDRETGKKLKKIPFSKEERIGKVYCKWISDIDASKVSYLFCKDGEVISDERARGFAGKVSYGKVHKEADMKAVFETSEFDWQGDKNPKIPYENCIVYCMHVRGFTKHPTSGVAHKGTFKGMTEKLDYLKEIGVTTIELQPAYEFLELPNDRELRERSKVKASLAGMSDLDEKKLNYWGYTKGYYYTPKAGYAAGDNVQNEFRQMVREFHKNGMEIVMQFYFPKEVPQGEIAEILRFWVVEYHVDGFHLMGEKIPMDLLATDPALADTKLMYCQFDTDVYYEKDEKPTYCNLAEYRDDYLYTMRKFLKGDEGMLGSALYQMRHIPEKCGSIHYLSNYFGFTLKDMVSYDYKHNEANEEENRDGNDYNCSWNCGEEGNTRKKKIVELRIRQMKNAMCMLMFGQSTPLIFMGDEFGNSQQGNNNPYCQDNRTTWLDWKDIDKNKEIHLFWKELVKLRREHPILRPAEEYKIMDYTACGYPDLSYHGESAWRPQMENHFRYVGMMFCGKYAKVDKIKDDDFFYVAMNMHWEPHKLALPKLPKDLCWKPLFNTGEECSLKDCYKEKEADDNNMKTIPARSITVFISENKE